MSPTINYERLYGLRNEYRRLPPDLRLVFLLKYGSEIMDQISTLAGQSLEYESKRATITQLLTRLTPYQDKPTADLAANVRLLFALEELSIPGEEYGIVFQVWKDGKCYRALPEAVRGVFERLLSKMEEIAPDARKALDAYHNEGSLRRTIESLQKELADAKAAAHGSIGP
jgi:hypothetical protein